ncbi:tRNA adenosine(34) deaminase TadA [Candidatus Rhabdochlamydia porcellionis]|uniref:tRNA-specific adenosine deaminase n=1 Tax=Candidatus Rhabdochlamydia porcellionis TaxID=225148 RepID=A0ABX8Z0N1_9BACT|nr:tRNA adenosine(34) deaminase TadA [Candidatus Rhabdochlamydia porcellionis]QZA58978.1 tRNA-specific adenosine deaminase [Candidatus Rhabdochlamydia porcellionis]
MENDIKFMQEALIEAKKAYKKQEVPVGAVLVLNDRIVARGYNQTEGKSDPTQHAEIICLQKASRKIKNWRLLQTTLYSTLEPCSMCAGALLQARVARLVWGAPDKRCGANGSFVNLFSLKHPFHQIRITAGVLEKECSEIMIHFFKQRRKERDGKCF